MNFMFESVFAGTVTLSSLLLALLAALVCGVTVAVGACFRQKEHKSFFTALLLLPVVVGAVIVAVNGKVGTGIAIAGAFSLVRFRSAAGNARQITAVFLAMTAGLICGAGYPLPAILFSLVLSGILAGLSFLPVKEEMILRITVPETLNTNETFEPVLQEHCREWELVSVKTTNMGSLFRLQYRIALKNREAVRILIDELRCRNGNLEVLLSRAGEEGESL